MIKIFGEFGFLEKVVKYLPKIRIEAPDRYLISLPIDKKSRNEVLEILKNKEYIERQNKSDNLKNDAKAKMIIKVKAIENEMELNEVEGSCDNYGKY